MYLLFVFLPSRVQEKLILPILSNELPKEIKNINGKHKFNAAVKSFLFDKMQQRDQSDFVYFKT